MGTLIDSLSLPEGLRSLPVNQLRQVADEARDCLIDTISSCGGHFASSLGVVELTVILHALFDTPHDRILWDVGHQGYIHKILTGRREKLPTIRQKDGISGFLKREESPYDAFGAGHAGTSVSAALGMAIALSRVAPERFAVPVIGDGALTCGMAFEALNHAGELGLSNLIVILNDNEMSISPNVGAHRWLFSKTLTGKNATAARSQIKALYQRGYVPETFYKAIDRAQTAAQGFFSEPAMFFESFRFRYIGPINGHCTDSLAEAIEHAKEQDVPVVVHVKTNKGHGYSPAEADPIKWHAVKPFDRSKGEFLKVKAQEIPLPKTYTQVFASTLHSLAQKNKKIVGITAAMAEGTGLELVRRELPESFFDVGICEQHAVTLSAGLACEGFTPVCAIYSTFLQRAFDQVIHDVCIQNLPVVFAIDRAGVVGNDGETHQGVFDIPYLRIIPGITVMAPSDENELQHLLNTAVNLNAPVSIRYPRGNAVGVALDDQLQTYEIGKARVRRHGSHVLFLCAGPLLYEALKAAEILSAEANISATVVDMRFIKPLDEALLRSLVPSHQLVCTVEDGAIMGGFGSAVMEFLADEGIPAVVKRFGIQDVFVPHASQKEQLHENGCCASDFVSYVIDSIDYQDTLQQQSA